MIFDARSIVQTNSFGKETVPYYGRLKEFLRNELSRAKKPSFLTWVGAVDNAPEQFKFQTLFETARQTQCLGEVGAAMRMIPELSNACQMIEIAYPKLSTALWGSAQEGVAPFRFQSPYVPLVRVVDEPPPQPNWSTVLREPEPLAHGRPECIVCTEFCATICLISCGHQSICDNCARQLFTAGGGKISCPLCRRECSTIIRPHVHYTK